jgi:hypothetical protein
MSLITTPGVQSINEIFLLILNPQFEMKLIKFKNLMSENFVCSSALAMSSAFRII